jgi:hypothetical protein
VLPSEATATATGATVRYAFASLPANGVRQTARLTFKDNEGVEVASEWGFTVSYVQLDPATRFAGRGVTRGLKYRFVQSPPENGALENTLQRAEEQLSPSGPYTRAVDQSGTTDVVNYSQSAIDGGTDANFGDDLAFPGQTADLGTDNWAAEFVTWLDLPAGITRFGVTSDDGYKLASAAAPSPSTTVPLRMTRS